MSSNINLSLETITEESTVAETTQNHSKLSQIDNEVRCTITSCTPKDMKQDNAIKIQNSPSENTISDNITTEISVDFITKNVQEQNVILHELSTAISDIFHTDFSVESGSSTGSLSSTTCVPKSSTEDSDDVKNISADISAETVKKDTQEVEEHQDDVCPSLSDHPELAEKLREITKKNYEVAKEVFKTKDEAIVQARSFEASLKSIFNHPMVPPPELCYRCSEHQRLKEKENASLRQSFKGPIRYQDLKDISRRFENYLSSHAITPGKNYVQMDGRVRKVLQRGGPPQIFDKTSLRQFLTPDGLEQRSKIKLEDKAPKENLTEPEMAGEVSVLENEKEAKEDKQPKDYYDDLVKVLTTATSDTSLLTKETRSIFTSPSDSRLLANDALAPHSKQSSEENKPRNAEEEIGFTNPFQKVFRRAALTDMNRMYRFMAGIPLAEQSIEDLRAPLPPNFFENAIKKLREEDRKVRLTQVDILQGLTKNLEFMKTWSPRLAESSEKAKQLLEKVLKSEEAL